MKCANCLKTLNTAFGEKLFTERREDAKDDACFGCHSTSKTEEYAEAVKKNVVDNLRITMRATTEDVGLSVASCYAIFFGCFRHGVSYTMHHDNAPVHMAMVVRNFLAKNNTVIMPQPTYSPESAPSYFYLFSKLKRTIKGRTFVTIKETKATPKSAY